MTTLASKDNTTKYKLTISYDGGAYVGWQYQPNGLSIQKVIEDTFTTLFKKEIKITGCSRTDAGVHALGQVATVVLEHQSDLRKLIYSLNSLLPSDIRINKIEEVDPNFHVRYSSKKKIYHYHLHCELFHNPCQRSYSHHVRHLFREEKVKEAILHFIGTHNFKAFANENSKGAASSSPVKTIYSIDLIKQPGGYRLEFEGNGFLYKMVRNIVGTLLECAKGKLEPSEIPNLIKSENRRLVPKSAPALGLFLVKIEY